MSLAEPFLAAMPQGKLPSLPECHSRPLHLQDLLFCFLLPAQFASLLISLTYLPLCSLLCHVPHIKTVCVTCGAHTTGWTPLI